MREIVERGARGGDAAVLALTERFDGAELGPDELRVAAGGAGGRARRARARRAGRRCATAIANVGAVVEAQLREPVTVELPEGQHVEVAELPVPPRGRLRARRAAPPTRRPW